MTGFGSTLAFRHLTLARKGKQAMECTDGNGAANARTSVPSDGWRSQTADDSDSRGLYGGQTCFWQKILELGRPGQPVPNDKVDLAFSPSASTLSKTACKHSFWGSGARVHIPINEVSTSILVSVKQKTKCSEEGLKDVSLSAGEEFGSREKGAWMGYQASWV